MRLVQRLCRYRLSGGFKEPAVDIGQGLRFALWLSSPCQGQGLLASWSRGLQIYVLAVFLICGGEPLSVPSPELLVCECAPFVPFWSSCGLTENAVVGSALSTLTRGYAGNWPCSLSRCRFHCAQAPGLWWYSPGPSVGALETVQSPARPSPRVHMSTKPAATKARPVPASGSLVALSVVSQALDLGSGQQRYNSTVCAAMRRFPLFFLSHRPLELSSHCDPTSVCIPPSESAPEAARAHQP